MGCDLNGDGKINRKELTMVLLAIAKCQDDDEDDDDFRHPPKNKKYACSLFISL